MNTIVGRSKQEDVPLIMSEFQRIFEADYTTKLAQAQQQIEELTKWLIKINLRFIYCMENSSFSINSSEKSSEQNKDASGPEKRGYRHTSLIYGT